jgi:YegS/Rv2252/BmrU family lipid kinase
VGGGDGTVNCALAAVLETGLPLGLLPMGTANDLARTLGVPADLEGACTLIASRSIRTIDIGLANGMPFVNAAGIGLSTSIARSLTRESKGRLGLLSYPAAVLNTLRQHRPFHVQIRSESGVRRASSIQLTVGNGVFYGGGTPLAEDAAIDDGRLDLYSIRAQPLTRMVQVAYAVLRGRQRQLDEGVDTDRGVCFHIDTTPRVTVSLDGEPRLRTPVRFSVAPGALRVFAPNAAGAPVADAVISGTGTA